ncbi:EexN family lipoprotein [Moraxella catarrhalis]|uniref:Lipoprotein n=1 Tax=Moraxella catarrhalis TaxID=480 RepID=A0A198UJQ8_MORCA|nr:EexN family lipoprotein [Moraxella catarrhalis]OAU96708.1 hypothetical protein AO384_0869 [Moraxella catarrhalis]OAU98131.1 hypothetical protein AO383_0800 [Moraxella catarrhalis]OAV04687.1 hypothetical protein AO385_0007 [Moraxella catarrhalis]
MNKLIVTASLLIITLSGCSEKTYTADYLLTDKAKRLEILEACKSNKQSTENCTNANTAQAAINRNITAKNNELKHLKYRLLRHEQINRKYQNSLIKEQGVEKEKELLEKIAKAELALENAKNQ